MIHFETVVLICAENEERGGVAVGHIFFVCNRNTFRELKVAITGIRNQWYRTNNNFVIPTAKIDECDTGGIVTQHAIVAGKGVQCDQFHIPVGQDITLWIGKIAKGYNACAERTTSCSIQGDVVCQIRAPQQNVIYAGLQSRVVYGYAGTIATSKAHYVQFWQGLFVAAVVKRCNTCPWCHTSHRITNRYLVILITYNEDIATITA